MIYLMRHGETEWNAQHRLQGRQNTDLTAAGKQQAVAYGERLNREPLSHSKARIISSPLKRALDTATIVAGALGVPTGRIEIEPRIIEIDMGRWDGLTWDEVQRDDGEAYAHRRTDRWNVPVPGGESFSDVASRVGQWLSEVEKNQTIIAVSHGGASRVIRGLYARLAPQAILDLSEPQDRIFRMANGSINELQCEGSKNTNVGNAPS